MVNREPSIHIVFVDGDGSIQMMPFETSRIWWNSGKQFVMYQTRTFEVAGAFAVMPAPQAFNHYTSLCQGAEARRAIEGGPPG